VSVSWISTLTTGTSFSGRCRPWWFVMLPGWQWLGQPLRADFCQNTPESLNAGRERIPVGVNTTEFARITSGRIPGLSSNPLDFARQRSRRERLLLIYEILLSGQTRQNPLTCNRRYKRRCSTCSDVLLSPDRCERRYVGDAAHGAGLREDIHRPCWPY
jgi:hypothetical protein